MKKISALVLVLIIATAVFAGCSGDLFGCSGTAAITLATGEKANWFNQNHYEKSTYEIKRYSANGEVDADGNARLTEIATGKYTITIEGMKSTADIPERFNASALNLSSVTKYNYTLFTIDFELTYNEKSNGLNGKTDTISSELLFYTSDLLPIYLFRSENYSSDGTTIDIETDYISLTNKVTTNGELHETEVKSGVYDNELMFYVMRAKSSLASGSSDTIEIFSPKDSVQEGKGKAVTKKMYYSSSSSFTKESDKYITVDADKKFIPNCYSKESLPVYTDATDDGVAAGYKIPRLSTGVYISEKNTGPVIQLNYSVNDFVVLGQTMKNVLLSIATSDYDYNAPKATLSMFTTYTISDYSIIK